MRYHGTVYSKDGACKIRDRQAMGAGKYDQETRPLAYARGTERPGSESFSCARMQYLDAESRFDLDVGRVSWVR